MRKIILSLSLWALLLTPGLALAFTIDIEGLFDGRDQLIIKGDTLQWHHFDYAAVGRHEGQNQPTYITTALMGTVAWTPEWAYPPPYEYPPPNEIRFEAYSSIFTGLNPPLPAVAGVVLSFTRISGRADLSIIQLPESANDYTLIVEFNDNYHGGSAWTQGRLEIADVAPVPVPATLLLVSSGLLFLWSRRKP